MFTKEVKVNPKNIVRITSIEKRESKQNKIKYYRITLSNGMTKDIFANYNSHKTLSLCLDKLEDYSKEIQKGLYLDVTTLNHA